MENKIANFPEEVKQKMLERQVEQGNKADITVFEKNEIALKKEDGFDWENTPEGEEFWDNVIIYEYFDLFFKKYPKIESDPMNWPDGFFTERVMLVADYIDTWQKRVVFAKKNGKFLAWTDAKTLEEANDITLTNSWKLAKIQEEKPVVKTKEEEIKYFINDFIDKANKEFDLKLNKLK